MIAASENCRGTEVVRGFPPLKQDQIEQADQECGQLNFERLQGQTLQNLFEQPIPIFSNPQSENKKKNW